MNRELPFEFACPACKAPLEAISPTEFRCPVDGNVYCQVDGIWRFLHPEMEVKFRQFIREYETVRQKEGRSSVDPLFYRSLPFQDLSGRFPEDWKIRARSFQALADRVIKPLEENAGAKLKILDLGAGNGWLSNRLAEQGHNLAAVDLLTNMQDGLGAYRNYETRFMPVQAGFDALPFCNGQADAVIFNASFHYSTDYGTTLGEALRVLRPGGQVIILDSPVYHDPFSGEQMVHEREEGFRKAYGFASNSLSSENFLTFQQLEELGIKKGLRWRLINANYGWQWRLRPWKARLLGRREPAQFRLICGSRAADEG